MRLLGLVGELVLTPEVVEDVLEGALEETLFDEVTGVLEETAVEVRLGAVLVRVEEAKAPLEERLETGVAELLRVALEAALRVPAATLVAEEATLLPVRELLELDGLGSLLEGVSRLR